MQDFVIYKWILRIEFWTYKGEHDVGHLTATDGKISGNTLSLPLKL